MNKIILFFLITASAVSHSQSINPYPFTTAEKRFEAYEQRLKLHENSLLKNVELRSIGPTVMSGRVVDIDVSPIEPSIFYAAYASGGLWRTTNNGISFTPLFDNKASMTIGDIAVDWNNGEIIWVGTGEDNSSRSSYAGTGIYKSIDTGKTWEYKGLAETHHTGKIILHPNNQNIIWAAALGHLYSPNEERGVFKSTDGGSSWNKTLYVDDNTGAIDLAIDPLNPNTLYAAMWYRTRRAWNFEEGGRQSGIYKSMDGGDTWNLLTTEGSGFPAGEGVGRIGLAVYPKNPQIIYAFLDNQFRREKKEEKEKPALTKEMLLSMSKEDFLKLEEYIINAYLDEMDFPEEYTAEKIIEMIKENKIEPSALIEYLEDGNQKLFDTDVKGAEVYRSDDGGKIWKRTHEEYINDMYYSYGYYFGEIRIGPNDSSKIYLLGVPILKSEDGGKTFKSINEANVHVDHHALWINPNKNGHLILGTDGGLNISYDDGKSWFKANTPAVGQFYTVAVDMEQPYNVYGGLQDNGVWFGPSIYTAGSRWQMTGSYPYESLLGGDGMQVAIDTTNNNTVYTGYQFGYYYRIDKEGGKSTLIKPLHKLDERPLRFNWQTPIHLSKFNSDIFYIGSNKFHRSLNKGETYEEASPDLTLGGKSGDVPFGTLTSIDESPFKFGLLYAGTDDGLVHISKDGGLSWKDISGELPENLWVSRVEASNHDTSAVYISLNGYRWDNFESYIFHSSNYGNNWERIGNDLPFEPANVIKEDPVNANVLYVGSDHGLYVSLNQGRSFMGLFKGMPHTPVHDLVIHPRDNELVIGTHGRSIYIADVSHIQKLTDEILSKKLHLFLVTGKTYNEEWGNKNYEWGEPDEPTLNIAYYTNDNGNSIISIISDDGLLLYERKDTSEHGLNYFNYDLSIDSSSVEEYKKIINKDYDDRKRDNFKDTFTKKIYLRPGKYSLEVEIHGVKETKTFEIKEEQKKKRGEVKKIP